MTHPGVPASPGFPPLEHAAQSAIRAAQDRLGVLTRGNPFPQLPKEEREKALEEAGETACSFCASWHPGASTAACPRLATFELNGDGKVVKGSFWPSGVTDSAVELDGDGKVRAVTHHKSDQWDTSLVLRVQDAAEEDGEEDHGAPDA